MAFVAVMMVYVYPLRMVISSGLSMATGGWVPSEIGTLGADWLLDVQTLFIVYGTGFGLLSGLLGMLNRHARRLADPLALDARERYEVDSGIGSQLIAAVSAALSILVSLVVLAAGPTRSPFVVSLPMWVYAALGVAMPLYHARRQKQLARLAAPPPEAVQGAAA